MVRRLQGGWLYLYLFVLTKYSLRILVVFNLEQKISPPILALYNALLPSIASTFDLSYCSITDNSLAGSLVTLYILVIRERELFHKDKQSGKCRGPRNCLRRRLHRAGLATLNIKIVGARGSRLVKTLEISARGRQQSKDVKSIL